MLNAKVGKFTVKATSIFKFIGIIMVMLSLMLPSTSSACRLYGIIGDNIPDGIMVNNLITDAQSLRYLTQQNGWGSVQYPNWGAQPTFTRSAEKPSVDGEWCDFDGTCVPAGAYARAVSQMDATKPKITIFHWRTGSSGCGGYVADAHPFYREYDGKTWSFIHNGGCGKELARRLIIDGNPDPEDNDWVNDLPTSSGVLGCYPQQDWKYEEPEGGWIVGDIEWAIDSELYFLLVMKHIKESHSNGGTTLDGMVKAIARLINHGETGGINFIFSDGHTMWGFKRGNVLSYRYDSDSGFTDIATIPLTGTIGPDLDANGDPVEGTGGGSTGFDESGWTAMVDYQLVVCQRNTAPIVYDIRDLINGNLNDDLLVDEKDRNIFLAALGSRSGDPEYNSKADYDGNGRINQADYEIWEQYRDDFNGTTLSDDHSNTANGCNREYCGATYLTLSGASGTIEIGGDVDFFRFTAIEGKEYTITTGGDNDTHLSLYDVDGEAEIVDNDDIIDKENILSQIVWTCPTTGVYYVRVRLGAWATWGTYVYRTWSEATGDYTLSLSVPDVQTAQINIDITPDNGRDYFRPSDLEIIPVVIFGSADFNPARTVTSSITLNGCFAAMTDIEFRDVNSDGYDDMSVDFETDPEVFKEGVTEFELLGVLPDGTIVQGTDEIMIKNSEESDTSSGGGGGGCFVTELLRSWW